MKPIFRLTSQILIASLIAVGAQAATPYFEDSFDSGAAKQSDHFTWLGTPTISTEQAYSGQYSVRFTYGPDADGEDSWSELRYRLASSADSAPRELWIEYRLRVPSNFVHRSQAPNNNKLFSIWAENYSNTGDIQAVFEYERSDSSTSHLRVICMSGSGCLKGNYYTNILDTSMRGKWIRLRFHIKAGRGDGLLKLWRDDELIYSIENYDHYFSSGNNYWRHGYLMGWSNSGYTEATSFFVDDFKVYVDDPNWGSGESSTGTTKYPPEAPTSVSVD